MNVEIHIKKENGEVDLLNKNYLSETLSVVEEYKKHWNSSIYLHTDLTSDQVWNPAPLKEWDLAKVQERVKRKDTVLRCNYIVCSDGATIDVKESAMQGHMCLKNKED